MVGITSANRPASAIGKEKKATKPRERTEKKKIQDRLAQRAAREKTKQRIASLEQALNSLKPGDDSTHTTSLMQLVANLRNNNSQLRSTINKIQNAISLVALIPEDEAPDHKITPNPWPSSSPAKNHSPPCSTPFVTPTELVRIDSTDHHLGESAIHGKPMTIPASPHLAMGIPFGGEEESSEHDLLEDAAGQDDEENDALVAELPVQGQTLEVGANTIPADQGMGDGGAGKKFDFDQHNIFDLLDQTGFTGWNAYRSPLFNDLRPATIDVAGGIVSDLEKWSVGNSAYFGALESVKRRVRSATTMDFQVAFQAALWGWKNVGQEADHPVWNALRQVDERIFGSWTSKAQRIAMMYVCQTLIQYREDPTPGNLSRVPGFLQPR